VEFHRTGFKPLIFHTFRQGELQKVCVV
jgi:hypothetical protein